MNQISIWKDYVQQDGRHDMTHSLFFVIVTQTFSTDDELFAAGECSVKQYEQY